MKEISIFFERLQQVFEYYGIKNVSDFALNWMGYTSPEKINRLKNPKNKPSYTIIQDISNKFDDIDTDWLLTGNGKMLKQSGRELLEGVPDDFKLSKSDKKPNFDKEEANRLLDEALGSHKKHTEFYEMFDLYRKQMEIINKQLDIKDKQIEVFQEQISQALEILKKERG